jgi:hypothetical protein
MLLMSNLTTHTFSGEGRGKTVKKEYVWSTKKYVWSTLSLGMSN